MQNITKLKGVKEVITKSVYEVIDNWLEKNSSSEVTKVIRSTKKYDKRGFCTTMEDDRGNVFETEYTDNGIVTKELMNGELKYEAFVDSIGNITGEIDYRINTTTSCDNIYTENGAGETILMEVTELRKESAGEKVRQTFTTYRKFNEFGHCLTEEIICDDNESGITSFFTKFDYDESNNLIHEINQYRGKDTNDSWTLAYERKNSYKKYPTSCKDAYVERCSKAIIEDSTGVDFDKYEYIFASDDKEYSEIKIQNSYHDGELRSITTTYYNQSGHLLRWTHNNIGGPILQGFNEFDDRGNVIRFTDLVYYPDGKCVDKIVTEYTYTYYDEETE